MTDKKRIFLLGGHDLEMLEIRKILEEKNETFSDRNLAWGAKLSEYKDLFDDDHEFIGVELIQDIEPPKNYKEIDHHNEKYLLPSSIEQVAEVLQYKLNPYQKLVSANDSGYIPEMIKCCASNREAMEVRKKDRSAQGITDEDEELASQSIAEKESIDGITIIKSRTYHFSAICDKLYPYQKLIIFSENELIYYGSEEDIIKLKKNFVTLIDTKNAFYGGNPNSFFGISVKNEKNTNIFEVKKTIIEILGEKNTVKSYHIFLFPFRWDYRSTEKEIYNIDFNERTQLLKFQNALDPLHWERDYFEFSSAEKYNTSGYFYEFANDAIFDEQDKKNNYADPDKILITFRLRISQEKKSTYEIFLFGKEEPYILNIEEIKLNIYHTGVAILSYYLSNYRYQEYQDILNINDFGRRIYPQFLDDNDLIISTKKNFLADRIHLDIELENNNGILTNETFCHYSNFNKLKHEPFKLPDHIISILGQKFTTRNPVQGEFLIKWLIDDRMFVVCWYGNTNLINDLQVFDEKTREYKFLSNPLWHQFIFIDHEGSSTKSQTFLNTLLSEHTYDRWIDTGYPWPNLFGISRYSFILLTNSGGHFAIKHLRTMYMEMVKLCLAQRASILKFSDEVTHISFKDIPNQKTDNIKIITQEYLKFVNKMYFREVTAQEQGIELYDRIQKFMIIENNVKELNREIDDLYQHMNLIEDKARNKAANKLNIIAVFFLPMTIFASLFGISLIDSSMTFIGPINLKIWIAWIIIVAGGLLVGFLLKSCFVDNKKKSHV